ncbi:LuxR C-terminal-related transcriptional regulator [Virgisporangium ochraceum]|nr:LuxR C-terminal-related transcriptional regulator [Virgisporangium ochraceum]
MEPRLVLTTKLFAPARRTRLVGRPRVHERLDATLETGHRLTLVSAPAGFGKTTALGDWLTGLSQRHGHVGFGWLSLDEGDNDPTRFLTHLVAALQSSGIDLEAAVVESLSTPSTTPSTSPSADALSLLVNELARVAEHQPARQWIVVLDDYHAIGSSDVHEAVTFLLDHLPDRLHLVVATRADPALPLARLRSRGQLCELRADDLRFTSVEAHEFLTRVMGLELTADDIDALEDRTEGWIAGLQLAALSLRAVTDRDEIAEFIGAFTGSNRFVIDYLADEVLARQTEHVRGFLLHTAVLDRLTGALCDTVTDGVDSTRTLYDLERANLFVVPLDSERRWYRYHHLFADVLRARLLAEHPEQVPQLHRRASGWFAAGGMVDDAVRHAVAGGDFDHAASLVEQAVPDMRRTRQDGVLLTWMRLLPAPVIRRSPVLSLVSSWAGLIAGDLDAAERRLDDAEAALAAGARDPELAATWVDNEDLRMAPAMVAVYRASLSQARGDVAGIVRHARHALDLAGPDDHFVRGAAGGFLGLAAWAAGDVEAALSTFADAVRSLRAAGNAVDTLDSTVVLADMSVAAGRPGRARWLYEQALRTATTGGAPYPRATADLHVGLADLDRERDDLTNARAHLESARALGQRGSITENQHRWYVVMAQVCAAGGDQDAAMRLLDQAETLYRHGFYPDVRPIAALRARIRIAGRDLSPARGWAEDRGISVDDEPDYLREYEHLTLARLLLTDGGSRPLLRFLDRLHTAAVRTGRHGSVREIRMLQALAHHADGDPKRALTTLGRSLLETPEPDGVVRLYLDEGAPMTTLLRQAVAAADEALRSQAQRILKRAATPEPQDAPPERLSHRELQVLRLLATDLTGPEIARELYVTLNTLRTHTKRIFTKLDVTTRAAAVRRAHDQGLL